MVTVNSSPPEHNGRHFAEDICICIFVNEKFCILIWISLKFGPKGPFDNVWAFVQVMTWRQIGDKPLPEQMLIRCIYAALEGNELNSPYHISCSIGACNSYGITNISAPIALARNDWHVMISAAMRKVLCQNQVWRARTSIYHPQYLWVVISSPCP